MVTTYLCIEALEENLVENDFPSICMCKAGGCGSFDKYDLKCVAVSKDSTYVHFKNHNFRSVR